MNLIVLRLLIMLILNWGFCFPPKVQTNNRIYCSPTHETNQAAWSTPTSRMVLLCALSGLSRRFQRWLLWLRPPSSSLSVVSWRATRGRLRLRELIRWRELCSWSLNQSGLRSETPEEKKASKVYEAVPAVQPAVCVLYVSVCVAFPLRVR